MVIEIAFRIALVEVILLDSLRFVIGPTSALGLFLSLPATLVLILCGLAIGIYFLEPFWRMKMVAALSLAIASRFRNTSVAYLTLFGVTSAVHAFKWLSCPGVVFSRCADSRQRRSHYCHYLFSAAFSGAYYCFAAPTYCIKPFETAP